MAISNNLHTSITRNTIADGDNLQANIISKLTQNDVDINNNIDDSEKKVDSATQTVKANSASNWANSAIVGFSAFTFKDDTTTKTFEGASKAAKNFTIDAKDPVTITKQNGKYVFDINVADQDNKTFSSYLRRAGYSKDAYSPSLSFIVANAFGTTYPYSFANCLQAQRVNGIYFGQDSDNITAVDDPAAANTEVRTGYNPDDGTEMTGYANTDVEGGSFVYQTPYSFSRKYSADDCSIGLFENFTAKRYSIAMKGAVAVNDSIALADKSTFVLDKTCASASQFSTVLVCNSTANNFSECLASDHSFAYNYSTCIANSNATGLSAFADNYSYNAVNSDMQNNTTFTHISAMNNSYAICCDCDGTIKVSDYSFAVGKGSHYPIDSTVTGSAFAIGCALRNTTASNRAFAIGIKGSDAGVIATTSAFVIKGEGVYGVTANNWAIALLPKDKHTLVSPSSFCHGRSQYDDDIRLTDQFALSHNNAVTFLTTLQSHNTYAKPSIAMVTTATDISNSIAIKCGSNSSPHNIRYYDTISMYNDDNDVSMTSGIALFESIASTAFAMFRSSAYGTNDAKYNAALYHSHSNAGIALFNSSATNTTNSNKKAFAMFGSTANNNDELFGLFENTFDIDTLPDITFARAENFDVPTATKRIYLLQDLS